MAHQPPIGAGPAPGPIPLRVFRIDKGRSHRVRFLTDDVYGCFIHYVKDGSQLCPGKECGRDCPRGKKMWKGYTLAEVLDPSIKSWWPVVLELTENAEVELRGQIKRRALVQLSREEDSGKKKQPVRARLLGVVPSSDALRQEIEWKPVLYRLYRVQALPPHQKNPLPDRIFVEAQPDVPGEPRQDPSGAPQESVDQEGGVAVLRSLAEEWRKRTAIPAPSRNGQH